MNHEQDAQGRTQGRTEETSQSVPDRNSQAGIEGAGARVGGVDIRVSGEDWSQGNSVVTLVGGILSQLIEDAYMRLAEMKESVVWYEREVSKAEKRIRDLEALRDRASGSDKE